MPPPLHPSQFLITWCTVLGIAISKHCVPICLDNLADIPSSFVVLIGIMINLSARKRMYRGGRQGDVGPVGPIGFAGFGASLGLLLLSSLSTYTRKRKGCI